MSVPTPILQYNLSDATMKGLLPAGYTPLAYIESTTSGQYIDTGFKYLSGNITVDCEYTVPSNNGATIFGSSNDNTKWLCLIYTYGQSSIHYCGIISGTWANGELPGNKRRITYSISGTTCTLNDGKLSVSANCGTIPAQTYSYTLWCHHYNNAFVQYAQNARIYYFRLIYQGNLTLDYRPARRDSDGVIGMYDLVSRTFKTNSGSGAFIAGPELAVGKGGGKSLPEEYLLVEYLESHGDSSGCPYIYFTNRTLLADDIILINTSLNSKTNNDLPTWFGGNSNTQIYVNASGNLNYWTSDAIEAVSPSTGTSIVLNLKYVIKSKLKTTVTDWRLFVWGGGSFPIDGKIEMMSVTRGSSVIVKLIPCYRKSDMKPGMYDVVNGEFKTSASSGEFILGPSITNCYTYEPNANINHALIPSAYLQVEYLLSTGGTLWINTTYPYDSTNTTYRVLCKFLMVSVISTYQGVYGAYTGEDYNTFRLLRCGSDASFLYGANSKAGGGGTIQGVNSIFNLFEVDHTYTQGVLKNLTTGDSHTTTLGHTAGTDTTSTFFVFAQAAGSTLSNTKIYYFKLYDNNKLERYMVPCYRKSDNKPGMYDIIHNVFYINNGSGEFTLGPNVYGEGLYVNCNAVYDSSKGWVAGFNNSCLIFSNPISLSNNFSISCWLDLTNINSTQYFIGFADGGGIRYGSDNIFLYLNGGLTLAWTFTKVNRFVHVIFTCTSNSIRLYIDGNLIGNAQSLSYSQKNCIELGRRSDGYYYNGKLYNFMIFDTALTAAQVKELYGK